MIKITDPKALRNYIPRSISNYNFEMFKNGHKKNFERESGGITPQVKFIFIMEMDSNSSQR